MKAGPATLTTALVLIGFAALTGQIILIRELLVIFNGNELSMSVILAAWLVWTALGSFCASGIADAVSRKIRVFALIQALAGALLPLSILAVRLSRIFWHIPTGEMAGFDHMLIISVVVLGPFCFFSGLLFAFGCGAWTDATRAGHRSAGHVYWLEALGAGLGGILFAAFFVHFFNHLQIAILISGLLLYSAIHLWFSGPGGNVPRGARLTAVLVLGALAAAAMAKGDFLERTSRQWQWRGYDLIGVTDTHYGNLAAVAAGPEIGFYENGLWMFTYPDSLSAEHSVHFALLAHPRPEQVLLIGGSLSGSLEETLKHSSIVRVDCVELDPGMMAFGGKVLPEAATAVLDDPRVRLAAADGRAFINKTTARYDVVIVNLPDPKTAQLNRFYTEDFFRESIGVLNEGGLMAVGLTASESIIGPGQAQTLASLNRTLKAVFGEVTAIPGSTAQFLASLSGDPRYGITADPDILSDRITARNLRLDHVRDYYLVFNLSAGRRAYFQSILEAVPEPRINADLAPSCYFYDLIQWSRSYAPGLASVLMFLENINSIWLFFVPALLAVAAKQINGRRSSLVRRRFALKVSCFVMGFSEMALSVILILVFQIFYGYLYYQMALLITLYMAGTAAGSRWMTGFAEASPHPGRLLVIIQSVMGLYPVLLLGVISLLYAAHPHVRLAAPMEYGFGVWVFAAGLIGGCHFPLAGRLYFHNPGESGRTGGMVYGMDLAGSALGALTAGMILVPVIGIPAALVLIGFLNLLAAWVMGSNL
jgi:spermidine synthase